MSGASVILFVNLMVGGLLTAFFLVLALHDRRLVSARWFAGAYAFGVAYVIGEFVIPFTSRADLVNVLSSTSMVVALVLLNVGLARRYKIRPPVLILGLTLLLSVGVFIFTAGMARDSMVRNFLYQTPYFSMQVVGAWIVLSGRGRQLIDLALASFLGMTALHYFSKPFASVLLGGPGATPQDYISTSYAMFSQSMGTVFVLATALILMALLVSDLLRDVTTRSVTDPLSGLLNRRGFEEKLAETMAKRGLDGPPLSLVFIDLDRFKSINDTFGHAAGDRVIEKFADILRETSAGLHVIGRVGGEEYAVALSHCNTATAQLFAESVRATFAETQVEGFPAGQRFSASFGVATLERGEKPFALLERADAALYEAKSAGRNCVRLAPASGGGSIPLRAIN